MNTTLQEEYVPVPARAWISLADSSVAVLNTLVTATFLTYYYTNLRGLSLDLAGIVWLIYGIWNAINDPIFGYISDRTKNALGRRIPYIRYGAPIYIIGYTLCWVVFPGTDGNQTVLFIQMLLALFLFDSLYTAIATSLYIMPYEIALSNKARSSIYLWKIGFFVFTIIIPLTLDATIKPSSGDEAGIGVFRWALIGIGIVVGIIVYVSTFFYKEKGYAQEEEQFDFIKSFKECFTNRSFITFETISFTVIFAQTALMQGLIYFFDEISFPGMEGANNILLAALAGGIIAGLATWIKQRDNWGIKTCMRLLSVVFGVGCLLLAFAGSTFIPAMIGFFCVGVGFSGGLYLIPLMNGDVVDYDEHRTGLRREGMYAGVNSFITKPAISLAQWSFLWFLTQYGYDKTLAKGAQSASAETGILLGWALGTGALLLASFAVLHFYPLAGAEWNKIKASLAEKHMEKERQYLARHGYKLSE